MLTLCMALCGALVVKLCFARTPLGIGVLAFPLASLITYILFMTLASWYAMLVLLVYLGGLLVMFAYFLAITRKQEVSLAGSVAQIFVLALLMTSISFVGSDFLPAPPTCGSAWYTSLYAVENIPTLLLVLSFLFLTLLVVVKVARRRGGPLRPFVLKGKRQGLSRFSNKRKG